jgi:Tfp pilus assembly protein PilO
MGNKILIYKVGLGVIIFLFIYLIMNTVIPEYINMGNEISTYNITNEQLTEKQNWKDKTVKLKRSIKELKRKIKTSNLQIPKSGLLSKPLKVLDSLALEHQVQILQIQSTSIDSSKQYYYISVNLSVKGSYFNSSKFIKQIEKQELVMNIEGLVFKLESIYKRSVLVDINLKILFKQNVLYEQAKK